MLLPFIAAALAALFGVQLYLCRKAKHRRVKLVPLVVIISAELVCAAAYAVSVSLERTGEGIYGAAFAAVIYGILLLIFLLADGAAWAVHGLICMFQKRKNNFQL